MHTEYCASLPWKCIVAWELLFIHPCHVRSHIVCPSAFIGSFCVLPGSVLISKFCLQCVCGCVWALTTLEFHHKSQTDHSHAPLSQFLLSWACLRACDLNMSNWEGGDVNSQLINTVTHFSLLRLSVGQSLGEKSRARTHTPPKWRREQILTAWWHSYTESHQSKPNLAVPSVLITETCNYCTFLHNWRRNWRIQWLTKGSPIHSKK